MMTGSDDLSNRDILDALIGFQTAVAEKFDLVDARFERFERDINRRFDLVDNRFDELGERFDRLEMRVDSIDKRVGSIEGHLGLPAS